MSATLKEGYIDVATHITEDAFSLFSWLSPALHDFSFGDLYSQLTVEVFPFAHNSTYKSAIITMLWSIVLGTLLTALLILVKHLKEYTKTPFASFMMIVFSNLVALFIHDFFVKFLFPR